MGAQDGTRGVSSSDVPGWNCVRKLSALGPVIYLVRKVGTSKARKTKTYCIEVNHNGVALAFRDAAALHTEGSDMRNK